jgi:hypothetical protein
MMLYNSMYVEVEPGQTARPQPYLFSDGGHDWSEENMVFVVWWVFEEEEEGKRKR